jgi:hypothetical protein
MGHKTSVAKVGLPSVATESFCSSESCKGVSQGGPLLVLFNFIVNCLTGMMIKAQHNGLVIGLISNLIPTGVAVLQYADDTIICLNNDLEKARNVKLLLYFFEIMSGLRINFDKSEVMMIGEMEI